MNRIVGVAAMLKSFVSIFNNKSNLVGEILNEVNVKAAAINKRSSKIYYFSQCLSQVCPGYITKDALK